MPIAEGTAPLCCFLFKGFIQGGPLAVDDAPSDSGVHPLVTDMLRGCPYRITSYEPMNLADLDPIYGLQLTHPRFLEFLGAPESARLLNGSLGHWFRTMDCEDAVAVALKLHDAGVMTSNLQVLDHFVTSLNRVSSEILRLAVGPVVFPSTMLDVLLPCPVHLVPLTTCRQWGYGGLQMVRVFPGRCRFRHAIVV